MKPHGYAGDYRMVELMHDLEGDVGADPRCSLQDPAAPAFAVT